MARRKRFDAPLTNKDRVSFPTPTPVMGKCLDEMADTRGIGRAELLRRITAAAIVADGPGALTKSAKRHRDAIETLATLGAK